MKKIKALILGAVLFCALGASAGQYDFYASTTLLSDTPTNVVTGVTNVVSYVIDCRYEEYVPFYLYARPHLTNTVTVNLILQKSVDGIVYDTVVPWLVNISTATNSLGGAGVVTNLNVGGVGYLKIVGIHHSGTVGVMTNFVIYYGSKR